jgi:hypothetical protein
MKWLVVAEKIDRCRQSNSWILVSRTIAEGKMSEINYRTLKLTPSFISRKTKLPRSTSSDSWPAVIYSMRISMQLIASGASKHSLMPQSREFASCEQFEALDEQIIRMQRLFPNQLEEGMLVSYGCCQFSTKLRLSAKTIMAIAEKQHCEWGEFAQRALGWGHNQRYGNECDPAHPAIHSIKFTDTLVNDEKRVYEL